MRVDGDVFQTLQERSKASLICLFIAAKFGNRFVDHIAITGAVDVGPRSTDDTTFSRHLP